MRIINLFILSFVIAGIVPAAYAEADFAAPGPAGYSRAPAGRRSKHRSHRRRGSRRRARSAPRCEHPVRDCGATTNIEQCMTCNAVREAMTEGVNGMISVNRTVIARSKSGLYPTNICAVIYQRSQFSWTTNPRTCVSPKNWARAKESAAEALRRGSNGKLYYHANYVRPRWAKSCVGRHQAPGETHIFYEFCGNLREVSQYRRTTRSRIATPNKSNATIEARSSDSDSSSGSSVILMPSAAAR